MNPILILLVSILFGFEQSEQINYRLKVGEGTSLKISGSTSISEFNCQTYYVPVEDTLLVTFSADSGNFRINNGKIIFRIREIECGDAYSNRQLINTLNGRRYPFILVELQSIFPGNSWRKSKAEINIEMAGVQRKSAVDLLLSGVRDQSLYFRGSKYYRMSSFELKPPKPMMGLVQVNDSLNIEFELWLEVLEQ